MDFFKIATLMFVSATTAAIGHAKNIGTIGTTYPIQEVNAVEMIMNKLHQLEKTGELKRLEQAAINRSMNSIRNPKPVENIVTVQKASQRLFDPTVTYDQEIATEDGTVIAPAGTKINPLDHISLSKSLVFFDGNDREQVEAVKKLIDTYQTSIRPILVSGSWLELSRKWKSQVYFDQNGYLSQYFGVTAVPSIIRQSGNMLEIQEIPAKELK